MPPPRTLPRAQSGGARFASAPKEEEESIYHSAFHVGEEFSIPAQPRVRTYHFAPTSPAAAGPGGGVPQLPKLSGKSHSNSSQIESILNPVRGPRDAQARAGVTPTDHSRNNKAALREQSQMNALHKMSIAEEEARGGPSRGYSGGRPGSASSRSTSAPHRPPGLAPRYSNEDDGGRNFVAENRLGAAAPTRVLTRTNSRGNSEGILGMGIGGANDGEKYLAKRDYGRVPQYLVERKMEMAADYEAAQRAKEAALIPPGMRILPEDERLETMAILQRNRAEVDRGIQQLPIIIETPGQIRRKDELERRLKEIEEAMKIFSRPKVMVHI